MENRFSNEEACDRLYDLLCMALVNPKGQIAIGSITLIGGIIGTFELQTWSGVFMMAVGGGLLKTGVRHIGDQER